jgi:hypothetical protein
MTDTKPTMAERLAEARRNSVPVFGEAIAAAEVEITRLTQRVAELEQKLTEEVVVADARKHLLDQANAKLAAAKAKALEEEADRWEKEMMSSWMPEDALPVAGTVERILRQRAKEVKR